MMSVFVIISKTVDSTKMGVVYVFEAYETTFQMAPWVGRYSQWFGRKLGSKKEKLNMLSWPIFDPFRQSINALISQLRSPKFIGVVKSCRNGSEMLHLDRFWMTVFAIFDMLSFPEIFLWSKNGKNNKNTLSESIKTRHLWSISETFDIFIQLRRSKLTIQSIDCIPEWIK